ncbi:MAG: LysM peptidoglycan-binding domain-containing protein [Silicimonas sp.]|nr:LysM peptidoglycan-binding domain-containing protein [Silicimonas sp.]
MIKIAASLLAAALALPGLATGLKAQSACSVYRVQKGDSLKELAKQVYGDGDYRRIWRANRAEVGRNPNVISVGAVLKLPCLDGALPETAAASAPGTGTGISLVTGNGYLPYTDESLKGRGLVTELVTKAMLRAVPETPVEVVFVNDWAAHLEVLLPRRAFDASFPWTRPDCAAPERLTPVETYACANFVYSDPVYEIVEGFFARPGTEQAAATRPAGLKAARICRPEGYPTGYLEELGLARATLDLNRPDNAYACFSLLQQGKVDLVAIDTRTGARVLEDLGLTHKIVENPFVQHIDQLRVALHRDNPEAERIVETLNIGLGILLASGEWANIVTEGLKHQAGALVN